MRKWEDIVKDKLEETENSLPKSVFSEFQTRLDGVETSPQKMRYLGWVITATAVAAGLVAVLILRHPDPTEDGIQIVQQTSVPVAHSPESNEVADHILNEPLITPPIIPSQVRPQYLMDYSIVTESCETEEDIEGTVAKPIEKSEIHQDVDPVMVDTQEETVTDTPIPSISFSFLPENRINNDVGLSRNERFPGWKGSHHGRRDGILRTS